MRLIVATVLALFTLGSSPVSASEPWVLAPPAWWAINGHPEYQIPVWAPWQPSMLAFGVARPTPEQIASQGRNAQVLAPHPNTVGDWTYLTGDFGNRWVLRGSPEYLAAMALYPGFVRPQRQR